ncbi:MAG: hypothetical protein R2699_16240 [Acidimicrobiales bacterium]
MTDRRHADKTADEVKEEVLAVAQARTPPGSSSAPPATSRVACPVATPCA